MKEDAVFVYARLNARVMPIDRGERFEDPLMEALTEKKLGKVTGGGTMMTKDGEIDYCGIDLKKGVPLIGDVLTRCGAPEGSKLEYEEQGRKVEVPFGKAEGLAIYLNGTDLPKKVYKECDINVVYDEINRLLGKHGQIHGHSQGPTETALYVYGNSFDKMRGLIADFITSYPLCQRARVEQIA